ncbi:YihY/virulence factor BrkB family protein [Parvularcula maris]|uniref:YihY/virulence factor BrkB family protein n=1 Tax=Parvularcula maris TaxID=2965077 RepID=A0A9X2L9F2_9PROT|nr:YihY/virulence factor BrkB family protein [Parvularcula maris]MCQ8185540.1 YihY/virulence factor BrkB family protein [Parvularcula maris]
MTDKDETARGRQAEKPWQIPPKGWLDILKRTQREIGRDHVSLVAAGAAFYSLLALFPAVAAVVAIWGLLAEPAQMVEQIDGLTAPLPGDIREIVNEQAVDAADGGGGTVLAALFGILLGIWSASKGMNAVMEGLNIVYDEKESRGFLKKNLVRYVLTLGAVVGVVLAAGLIVVLPAVLENVGLGSGTELLIGVAKWALLLGAALIGFGVVYRYAPARRDARWAWITPGAVLAVILWLIGSAAFSFYVSNFASYNETYGTIGGVVVTLMWLFLTAFVILLGGEVNAEIEKQTRVDTTVNGRQEMGNRGAYAADHLGKAPA